MPYEFMNIFDRYYKRYDNWYEKNKLAYLSELKAIRKVMPGTGKGLEVGVGTGRFAAILGIRAGVDPSKKMVAIARQRGVNARMGAGEHLPYKKSSFDYVLIIVTLCFARNPMKVLTEARRVLKNNGKIVIGIVNKNGFLGRFYQKKKSVFYKKAHFFTVKDVTDLLKATGFNRITFWQTLFTLPSAMKSVHMPRKGFGRGGFVVITARRRL